MKKLLSALVVCVLLNLSRASAVQDGKLLIWINGDKAYTALAEIGKKFAAEAGIPVTVEHPTDLPTKFAPAAQSGNGPDIVFWAHDRLGSWAASGLIQPLNIEPAYQARFLPKSWEAFTYDGKIWGYPVCMESVALIYNKALIQAVPPTLLDMKPGTKPYPILWAYDTPFFTWPFLAGAGGYVFGKKADGSYDISDIGVSTPGAVKALQHVADMIKTGVMPKGVTYDVVTAQMQKGQCAMMVNGPWAWNDLKKYNIDFGIGFIPGATADGPAKPFVGVLGAMIDAKTPNKELADLFIRDYVLTPAGLAALDKDTYDGPHALIESYEIQKADPRVEASMKNVELGVLMPNIPQMATFWAALDTAVKTVTSGQGTAQEVLDSAAKNMKQEIAGP